MTLKDFEKEYENHLIYKKKINALINYTRAIRDFDNWEPLERACRYIKRSFLTRTMCLVIDSLLEDYKIDYLDWCFKDTAKKRESNHFSPMQLELFPLSKKRKMENWKEKYELLQQDEIKYFQMRAF